MLGKVSSSLGHDVDRNPSLSPHTPSISEYGGVHPNVSRRMQPSRRVFQ